MLYNIKDVASILRISEKTARNLISNGELAYVRVGKSSIRVRPDSLDAYLRGNEKKEVSE